eukprot:8208424-Pyramimonas_sp.AAC.1
MKAARKAFFGQLRSFEEHSVPLVKRFRRFCSVLQASHLYGAKSCTRDRASLQRMHVLEGSCLLKMNGGRGPLSRPWGAWRRCDWISRVVFVLYGYGCQSAVQRALAWLQTNDFA